MSGATDVLSRQISSAKDLSTVVRSMKALAASSLGQYEKAVESLNGYYHAIELGLSQCLRQIAPARDDPPAQQKRSTTIGAVVFGSDQGLVGRFNEVLMEFTVRELEKLPGKVTRTWAVGDRMQALVADSGLPGGVVPAAQPLSVPNSVEAVTPMVGRILMDIQAATERGEVVEVYLFYNRSMSSAAYEPVVKRLLPLDAAWRNHLLGLPWPTKSRPEVLGEVASALRAFIREYLFVLLFQACAESLASENGSRLAAMQRAETNIRDILQQLTSTYHRIRQESIDEELFEVIAGCEAMRL